jgi:hypothetical protein
MLCWYCMRELDGKIVEYTVPSRKKKKKILQTHDACLKSLKRARGRKRMPGSVTQ